jgi:transcriptional regulator of aromatic amino acid metabolism
MIGPHSEFTASACHQKSKKKKENFLSPACAAVEDLGHPRSQEAY